MRICILGWGSLIWDKRPEFDEHHGMWNLDGLTLRLEFSRVSASRQRAHTLEIDPVHGAHCRVAYAESSCKNPDDAICDLRSREGTVLRHIGAMFLDGFRLQGGDETTREAIRTWAQEKQFDVVVWTDLPADFQKKTGMPFSVDAACNHLQELITHRDAGYDRIRYRTSSHPPNNTYHTPSQFVLGATGWAEITWAFKIMTFANAVLPRFAISATM